MSVKILMTLNGAQKVRSLFQSLPPGLRKHVGAAVRETTAAVERGAKMRAPVSAGGHRSRKAKSRPGPGELRDTIRSNVLDDESGVVGFVSAGHGKLPRRLKGKATNKRTKAAKARRRASRGQAKLGAYAMVLEYGSPRQGKTAKPYMRPALEAEKPRHQQRMTRAVQRAAAEAAAKARAG